jgi:hypothetical protein
LQPAPRDAAASALTNSATLPNAGSKREETAFLDALAARRTALQLELTAASEAANLYAAQLATNNSHSDLSSIHYLIRDNGYVLKQLQKELGDLELRDLEFRALRKR